MKLHPLLLLLFLPACASSVPPQAMRTANAQFQHVHGALARGWYGDAAVPWEQVKANVRRGVEARPLRKHDGQEIDLLGLLAAWERGPAAAVPAALASRDPAAVHRALAAAHHGCVQCHDMVGVKAKKLSPLPAEPESPAAAGVAEPAPTGS